ncbi:MAG TPA: GGDEF domain-containing protein [Terracidiphilus sp.]
MSFDRSDPVVTNYLAKFQRISLAIVMLVAVLTLGAWTLAGLGLRLPAGLTLMKINTVLALLLSTVSLTLSQPPRSKHALLIGRLMAIPVGLLAAESLLEHVLGISFGFDTLLAADTSSYHPGLMSTQAALMFLMLAIVLFFIRAEGGVFGYAADLLVVSVGFLVLVLLSGFIFGATSPVRVAPNNWTSPQTMISLGLLCLVAFGQRAEHGVFAILIRRGIGGKIARILTPILLILPFLREMGRIRLIHNHLLPEHYTTAVLASSAAVLSFAFLMVLARHINGLEKEIHDLSLRDGLTGLYNLRGFNFLAEQALRLAQRDWLPFSVLYLDMDNLKTINDQLGHGAGSAFLVEIAALLQTTFRETDVVGRVGGDEFAVAGQLNSEGMAMAVQRLEEASESALPDARSEFPLSFSHGFVTTRYQSHETLEDLLARADKAMYEHKKGRKLQPR